MNRDLQALFLMFIAAVTLNLVYFGGYLSYVQESHKLLLVAAAVLLLAVGFASAWLDDKDGGRMFADAAPTGSDEGQPHDDTDLGLAPDAAGHGHDHRGAPRVAWLLALPVLTLALVAPPPLGATFAARDSGRVAPPEEGSVFDPLPDDGVVELEAIEYAQRAVYDQGRTLDGRTVELVGFVTPERGSSDWYLTRILMSCCAADGQALKIETQDAPDVAADTWVSVTGRWVPSDGDGAEVLPIIEVESVEEVAEPRDTYG